MKLYLAGVLTDGTDFAPDVSANTAKVLRIPVGATVFVQLDVLRPDGSVPDLTGYTATWSCRKNSDQVGRLPGFTKTATLAGAPNPKNRFVFALVPADTKFLVPGRFVHDAWVVSGAGARDQVMPLAALVLVTALALP